MDKIYYNKSIIIFKENDLNGYLTIHPNSYFSTSKNIDVIEELHNNQDVYAIKNDIFNGATYSFANFIKYSENGSCKKCESLGDAYSYIYGENFNIEKEYQNVSEKYISDEKFSNVINSKRHRKYDCFIDGSYEPLTHTMGFGYKFPQLNISNSAFVQKKEKGSSVTAELMAATMAISRAIEEGFPYINLYYDCAAVEILANNEPTSKKNLKYYNFIQKSKKHIKINFKKVKAHSGNQYNDYVDSMVRHEKIDHVVSLFD